MAEAIEPGGAGDPHNLDRFVRAQEGDYARALSEINGGRPNRRLAGRRSSTST